MTWDPRADAWLAGFTAGEGCFSIARIQRGRIWAPNFQLKLRADDVAILEQLCEAFGGKLSYNGTRSYPWDSKPQWQWLVASKRDLAGLVTYFDRFPLHAKKARDYDIWRRAVRIYCARGGVDHDGQLEALRNALVTGRAFDAPEMDQPDSVDPLEVQLALGIGDTDGALG